MLNLKFTGALIIIWDMGKFQCFYQIMFDLVVLLNQPFGISNRVGRVSIKHLLSNRQ